MKPPNNLLDLKVKHSLLNSCKKSNSGTKKKLSQQKLSDQLIANSRAPTKSGFTVKRISKLDQQKSSLVYVS